MIRAAQPAVNEPGSCFNRLVRVVAVVLAAGVGRRMGGTKALLRIEGVFFLERVVQTLGSAADRVIPVLGSEAERVCREARLPPSTAVVVNEAYSNGMLSSILRGLDAAEADGADAVLVHPVDHPLVTAATVGRVAAALRAGVLVPVASYQGRRGHPAGFGRPTWPALRSADPRIGARQVLRDHPEWVALVEGDKGALAGIDTPDDYRHLIG
jgi:CTP:molybdopterin cytidylyltransferase MocA